MPDQNAVEQGDRKDFRLDLAAAGHNKAAGVTAPRGHVPMGVTAHGGPGRPLQFDRPGSCSWPRVRCAGGGINRDTANGLSHFDTRSSGQKSIRQGQNY